MIKWPVKLYVRFFYVFLRFFQNPKKHDFLRFFELLHTFSRTVLLASRMRCRTEQAYVTTLASGLPITRSPAELKGLSYPERLKLTTLETRRLRCDLIEVSKTLKGLDKIDKNTVFFF